MKRVRFYAASSVVAATLVAAAMPSISAHATASAGDTDASIANCKKYSVQDTYPIDSAGRRTVAASAAGTVRVFGKGKNVMKVTVPPAGFNPHAASDAQLKLYGFPARPKAGPARERWNRTYPDRKLHFIVPEMCSHTTASHAPAQRVSQTRRAGSPVHLSAPGWSGGIATRKSGNPAFTASIVRWTQPSFYAGCSSKSSYAIWSGLGGWGTDGKPTWGLLQAGVDNFAGTAPNDAYVWWEALNQNAAQTLPEQAVTNLKVLPGNEIQAVTYYNPAEFTVSFQVFNLTTGKGVLLGPWTSIVDQGGTVQGVASDYYDGSSAETIAERVKDNTTRKLTQLRQPTTDYSKFLDAELGDDVDGDFFPGNTYPNWQAIDMNGDPTPIISTPSTFPMSGTPTWKNTWSACT